MCVCIYACVCVHVCGVCVVCVVCVCNVCNPCMCVYVWCVYVMCVVCANSYVYVCVQCSLERVARITIPIFLYVCVCTGGVIGCHTLLPCTTHVELVQYAIGPLYAYVHLEY